MRVRKHGWTSGLTDGVITDEPYDTLVGMDHSDSSVVAKFTGQMRIERAGSSYSPLFSVCPPNRLQSC
jgi:hypothetical protein